MRAERPRGPRPGLHRGAEEEAEALPRQVVCWPSRRGRVVVVDAGVVCGVVVTRFKLLTAHGHHDTASPVFRPAPTPANYKFKLRFAAMAIPSSPISKSMKRELGVGLVSLPLRGAVARASTWLAQIPLSKHF